MLPPGFSGCRVVELGDLGKNRMNGILFFCFWNELVIGVFVVFCFDIVLAHTAYLENDYMHKHTFRSFYMYTHKHAHIPFDCI